jgi:hypothetical protein
MGGIGNIYPAHFFRVFHEVSDVSQVPYFRLPLFDSGRH